MKLSTVITAAKHINHLGSTSNYQNLYHRVKLAKWLQEQVEQHSILEQSAIEDCGGEIRSGSIHFSGTEDEAREKAERFLKARKEINAVEVEAPPKMYLTDADLNGTALASETVLALEPFIDFAFMRDENGCEDKG